MNPKGEKAADEHYRLGGRPPLWTILVLSFGPILSQESSALFGFVDSIWVSKAIGTKGLAAVSTYTPFDNIGRAFAFFLSVSGSSKISALFGAGKGEETSQVVCDLLRVELIFAVCIPCAFLPWVTKAAMWFGASQEIAELGFNYIAVTLGCQISTGTFYAIGGFLQGEGRTLLFGLANVCSCFLNMLLFDPVFLYFTDLSVGGAAIATILSDSIPAVTLFIMYFTGRFSIKPKFSQFFKKFSPHTLPAIKVGFSALIAQLSMSVPGILIQWYIGNSAQSHFEYSCVLSGNTVVFRIAMLTVSVMIAFNSGYLPCAAYAYAAKKYKRWIRLSIHLTWINFAWGTFCSILIVSIPVWISKLFVSEQTELYFASTMLFNGCCGFCVAWIRNNAQVMLQSLQKGLLSTFLSLTTQMILLVIFSTIMYLTNKHNAPRIEWSYPLSFLVGGLLCIVIIWKPCKNIYELSKTEKHDCMDNDIVLDEDEPIEIMPEL